MKIYFANNIRRLRLHNGLTQKSLAKKLKITERQVQNLEYGKSIPTTKVAIKTVFFFKKKLGYTFLTIDKFLFKKI